MNEAEMDKVILSYCRLDWRKTAFIIAKALHHCGDMGLQVTDAEIAARIVSLCNSDYLQKHGSLSGWRSSEIRLREGRLKPTI